jgi:hypothetical protein
MSFTLEKYTSPMETTLLVTITGCDEIHCASGEGCCTSGFITMMPSKQGHLGSMWVVMDVLWKEKSYSPDPDILP